MRLLLMLLTALSLYGSDSFITKEEYAKQLYHNPRGIGCHLCHGEQGQGRIIANYEHKKEKKTFGGPSIKDTEYSRFAKALNSRVRGMPRYFLTDMEIQALYYYLQMQKKKGNDGQKHD
jgi:hypothetical protein